MKKIPKHSFWSGGEGGGGESSGVIIDVICATRENWIAVDVEGREWNFQLLLHMP